MDKYVYASTDTLPRTFNPLNEIDVDQIGEIVDSTIETNSLVDDDPVFQSLTESQAILNQAWSPSLNTVTDETEFDIRIALNQPIIKQTNHVATKRYRGQQYKDLKLRKRYEDKIGAAIAKNGIHKVTIATAQNNSGANRSVTNQKKTCQH